jgi:prokaryotic ubiquitin-like protein Pup
MRCNKGMRREATWSPLAMELTRLAADEPEEMTEHTVRIHEQPRNHHSRAEDVQTEQTEHGVDAADLKHDLDEILDEIDSLLEENAEEFVQGYVQKGGE